MRIVIEQSDFRQLSPEARREIIEKFAGEILDVGKSARSGASLSWRAPVDLWAWPWTASVRPGLLNICTSPALKLP